MYTGRDTHTASVLSDGKLVVVGGSNAGFVGTAELYDPSTGNWTKSANLSVARWYHTESTLLNGSVLVVDGGGSTGYLNSGQLCNPLAGTWTTIATMNVARSSHKASVLLNGTFLTSAEKYNPFTNTWAVLSASMNTVRCSHTISLLPNEQILVAGGYNGTASTNTAELY